MKRVGYWAAVGLLALFVTACGIQQDPQFELLKQPNQGNIRVNVLLNTDATPAVQAELSTHGSILDVIEQIDTVSMMAPADEVDDIERLPFVESASPDVEYKGIPIDTVAVDGFDAGLSTWNLDSVNVTAQPGFDTRSVELDGSGVYVAVLDTGLMDTWRQYFPEERIAEEYAIAFGGGGADQGFTSDQPNKWEHDVNGHGSHVTSTIIGYSFGGTPINGVAPGATVIPVKVLNQNGSGWSSVVAAGITYVADLKANELSDHPVVINMSLGGPGPDPISAAAVDYAVDKGVIIVASAGNEGELGMGYPGAYAPVISVAASGWADEWTTGSWWNSLDVAEPTSPEDFYITDFSSRELAGQELDVAAPGSWVVGPYQLNSGQISYYFLGGTSMASPHVAGVAALLMQQDPTRVQAEVEATLKGTAIPFDYDGDDELCRDIIDPNTGPTNVCWGPDASGAGLVTADAALAGISGDTAAGEGGSQGPGNSKGGVKGKKN
ncbi:MAG TPA: S8 family serine peptidase [Trueperaceae bacterium]